MTWGGLRGGIPVALALSLPVGHKRELLLMVTYIIVVFSVVVQGLSFPALLRWALPAKEEGTPFAPTLAASAKPTGPPANQP